MPLPKSIVNAPDLAQGLVFYYIAYKEISSCRDYTMSGPVPISWWLIHRWCNAHELDEEMEDDVHYHVTAMDDFHRDWMKTKGKSKIGKDNTDGHKPAQPAHPQNSKRHRGKR